MELQKRKKVRLESFDYSSGYSYFVTICTHNRENILSQIVGEGSALPLLTKCGEIVRHHIENIPEKYSSISIDYYVIMPNHIHLLVSIIDDGRANPSPTLTSFVGWFKYQSTKDICKQMTDSKTKIFQRSFYDHVIRNRRDYEEISEYIFENPINWQVDEFYN